MGFENGRASHGQAPAPAAQAALLEALKEAQAGLEFAAARLPHTTGFVPSHIAALNIVNAALAAAPTTQAAPVAQVDARAEQALLKVLAAVQRYLPPDGPSAKDTLSEIIGIVDPWPLGDLKGKA